MYDCSFELQIKMDRVICGYIRENVLKPMNVKYRMFITWYDLWDSQMYRSHILLKKNHSWEWRRIILWLSFCFEWFPHLLVKGLKYFVCFTCFYVLVDIEEGFIIIFNFICAKTEELPCSIIFLKDPNNKSWYRLLSTLFFFIYLLIYFFIFIFSFIITNEK